MLGSPEPKWKMELWDPDTRILPTKSPKSHGMTFLFSSTLALEKAKSSKQTSLCSPQWLNNILSHIRPSQKCSQVSVMSTGPGGMHLSPCYVKKRSLLMWPVWQCASLIQSNYLVVVWNKANNINNDTSKTGCFPQPLSGNCIENKWLIPSK